ncbi:unnamed protein product, partial [Cyprideis torosa]
MGNTYGSNGTVDYDTDQVSYGETESVFGSLRMAPLVNASAEVSHDAVEVLDSWALSGFQPRELTDPMLPTPLNISGTHLPSVLTANQSSRTPNGSSGFAFEVTIPLYLLIFVLAILGNTTVILTLGFNRRLRSVTNMFLLNLYINLSFRHTLFQWRPVGFCGHGASTPYQKEKFICLLSSLFFLQAVADFLLGVFCMPATLIGALLRDFIFGLEVCKLLLFLQGEALSTFRFSFVAVADFLLGVFCMPATLIGALLRDFIFGLEVCKLLLFLQAVTVSVSVWTLVAISLERYFAICRPLTSRTWQTRNHAFKVIASIWSFSCFAASPIAAMTQYIPIRDTAVRPSTSNTALVRIGDLGLRGEEPQRFLPLLRWSSSTSLMIAPMCSTGLRSSEEPGNSRRHKCREVWPSAIWEKLFGIALDFLLLVIPLFIMVLMYSMIAARLWKGIKSHTDMAQRNFQQNSNAGRSGAAAESSGNDGSEKIISNYDFPANGTVYATKKCLVVRWHPPPVVDNLETSSNGPAVHSEPESIPSTSRFRIRREVENRIQPRRFSFGGLMRHPLRRHNAERSVHNKRKVIQMLFVLVLEFFICWTPLYVMNTWTLFDSSSVYKFLGSTGVSLIQLMAYLSSCCNPITYCFMHRKFRNAFITTIRCKRGGEVTGTMLKNRQPEKHEEKGEASKVVSGDEADDASDRMIVFASDFMLDMLPASDTWMMNGTLDAEVPALYYPRSLYESAKLRPLRESVMTGKTKSHAFRLQQLHNLRRMYEENTEEFIQALQLDLRKSRDGLVRGTRPPSDRYSGSSARPGHVTSHKREGETLGQ